MGLFSKELQILDKNTVQYMIDQMQDTIDEQQSTIQEQQNTIKQKSELLPQSSVLLRHGRLFSPMELQAHRYAETADTPVHPEARAL